MTTEPMDWAAHVGTDESDAKLAAKIVNAIKEYDAANKEYTEAETALGSKRKAKQIAAGKLLIEARKRHPTEKAFEKFLELAGGIGLRRAQDFIAFAIGRKDFDRHQAENAAAQQRHRDKLKADKIAKAALPKPEPKHPEPKHPEASRITSNASPKPEPEPTETSPGAESRLAERLTWSRTEIDQTFIHVFDIINRNEYWPQGTITNENQKARRKKAMEKLRQARVDMLDALDELRKLAEPAQRSKQGKAA